MNNNNSHFDALKLAPRALKGLQTGNRTESFTSRNSKKFLSFLVPGFLIVTSTLTLVQVWTGLKETYGSSSRR